MDEGKEGGMWEIHFKHIGDIGGSKSQNRVRASVCLPPSPSVSALLAVGWALFIVGITPLVVLSHIRDIQIQIAPITTSTSPAVDHEASDQRRKTTSTGSATTATLPTSAENAVSVHFFSFFFFCCFSFLVFEAV